MVEAILTLSNTTTTTTTTATTTTAVAIVTVLSIQTPGLVGVYRCYVLCSWLAICLSYYSSSFFERV